MPKYAMAVIEEVEYRVTVTADSLEEAQEKAIDEVIEGGDRHFHAVHERDAYVDE